MGYGLVVVGEPDAGVASWRAGSGLAAVSPRRAAAASAVRWMAAQSCQYPRRSRKFAIAQGICQAGRRTRRGCPADSGEQHLVLGVEPGQRLRPASARASRRPRREQADLPRCGSSSRAAAGRCAGSGRAPGQGRPPVHHCRRPGPARRRKRGAGRGRRTGRGHARSPGGSGPARPAGGVPGGRNAGQAGGGRIVMSGPGCRPSSRNSLAAGRIRFSYDQENTARTPAAGSPESSASSRAAPRVVPRRARPAGSQDARRRGQRRWPAPAAAARTARSARPPPGSAASRAAPSRPGQQSARLGIGEHVQGERRAPSAAVRPAGWLRLVTTTRQPGLAGSSGRT